jgi:hypothetical protein
LALKSICSAAKLVNKKLAIATTIRLIMTALSVQKKAASYKAAYQKS